ncbi:hypothetical protein SAMN02745166_03093 [Prosthecobacter debontii]|uniref:Lipoprotein n=1 Tax=Prosthecobacter debontii TaxID=48467 RepID=A0A1T4YEF0_9BACT|nr:hypothetical protein [Prosthecobacter debontii]SKB00202.1 hypothetical protein SAMN02745166_03093 [Prosthecobacter debontii]
MNNFSNLKKMKTFLAALLIFSLSSCAASKVVHRLNHDSTFQYSAEALVRDYLNSQMYGEDGRKFGITSNFYNLMQYHIEGMGVQYWQPAVIFRAQAGNQLGGITWKSYCATLRHDPKAEAMQDAYSGLRLTSVKPTVEQLLRDN